MSLMYFRQQTQAKLNFMLRAFALVLAISLITPLHAQHPADVTATGAFAGTIITTRSYLDYQDALKNACKGNLAVKNTDATQGTAIGKDFNGTLTLPEAKNGQSWICLMTLVSDDGCEMSIDNAKPWLTEYGKSHDISKGARPWPGVFTSGKTYDIKIRYSQVWYKPGINDLDGISVILCLMPIDLAVDADRDGLVTFGTDTTTSAKPFRFWINEDHDHGTNTEDLTGERNCDDGIINGIRDLEDFTVMKMKIPQSFRNKVAQQNGKIGFCWKDTSDASPSCRLFTGSPSLAKTKDYLSDEDAAETVRASNNQFGKATLVSGNRTAWLRSSLLPTVHSDEISLLMEGCATGRGKLMMVLQLNGQNIDAASIDIHLLKVGEMYERGRITVDARGVPDPWVDAHPPALTWAPDTAAGSPKPDPDAKAKTIIWVHGWRMDYAEYASWADVSFKRLWQMGFKGKFYAFRWPTLSAENDSLPNLESLDLSGQLADGGFTFNSSEYRAWLSGPALANFVNQTPNSGNRYFLAHSLGNVTAASALNSGMSVKKYAMLNAAMASMAYDGVHIPADADADFVTIDTDRTPNAAAFWGLANRVKHADTQLVNFGLPLDHALGKWTYNNNHFRPQWWADLSGYGYDRSESDPNKKLYYGPLAAIGIGSTRILDTEAEAFGYCVQARTRAAGCKLSTGNMSATIDMRDYGNATEHSAQWVRPIQTIYPFWKRLMEEFNEDLSNR